jgi:hypothetical protein
MQHRSSELDPIGPLVDALDHALELDFNGGTCRHRQRDDE